MSPFLSGAFFTHTPRFQQPRGARVLDPGATGDSQKVENLTENFRRTYDTVQKHCFAIIWKIVRLPSFLKLKNKSNCLLRPKSPKNSPVSYLHYCKQYYYG